MLAVPVARLRPRPDRPAGDHRLALVVAAGAVAGGLSHARAGRVCWRHAGSFTAAALPGIVAGTLAGEAVSGPLLLAALRGRHARRRVRHLAQGRRAQPEREGTWEGGGACPPLRLPRDLVAGAAVGIVTGFFGVGGGFLIVPTLAVALAFTMRTAVGTSLAIITATSLLGLASHLLAGRTLDPEITAAMTAACVVGALAGAAGAARVPQRMLGRAFALHGRRRRRLPAHLRRLPRRAARHLMTHAKEELA